LSFPVMTPFYHGIAIQCNFGDAGEENRI